MKVFINEDCYVNVFDLYRKGIPSYLRIDKTNYKMNDFVEITYNSSKELIKNREDILNYDDIIFCSNDEIKEKMNEIKFKIRNSEYITLNEDHYKDSNNVSKTDIYKAIYEELNRYLENGKEINKEIESLALRSKRKLLMK